MAKKSSKTCRKSLWRRLLASGASAGCLGTYFYQQWAQEPAGVLLYLYYFPMILWGLLLLPLALTSNRRGFSPWAFLTLGLTLTWFCELEVNQQPPSSGPRLRIVTANLQSWEHDPIATIATIRELKPDIILLQELWSPIHLKELEAALPRYILRGDSTYFAGTVVASKYFLEQCPIPPPDNCSASVLVNGDDRILLLSVHGRKEQSLSHSGLEQTWRQQNLQAQELRLFLDTIELPVIVGTDLNAPTHAPLTKLFSERLEDSFSVAGNGYGYTFPAFAPVSRLDRIFYSRELGNSVSCKTIMVGSDHKAVLTDLSVKNSLKIRDEEHLLRVHGHTW